MNLSRAVVWVRVRLQDHWRRKLSAARKVVQFHFFSCVPALYNLPGPPYRLISYTTIRIGENPPDFTWDFASIAQI